MGNTLTLAEPDHLLPPVSTKDADVETKRTIQDTFLPVTLKRDDERTTNAEERSKSPKRAPTQTSPTSELPLISGQLLVSGAMAAAETLVDAGIGASKFLFTAVNEVSKVPEKIIHQLSRPPVHQRWASRSDFRVGSHPKLISKVAKYLTAKEIRKARGVSWAWLEALEGLTRSLEIRIAVLEETNAGSPMVFGFVGVYAVDHGRFIARFRPIKRYGFKRNGFKGIRIAIPAIDPFATAASLHNRTHAEKLPVRDPGGEPKEDEDDDGVVGDPTPLKLQDHAIRPLATNALPFRAFSVHDHYIDPEHAWFERRVPTYIGDVCVGSQFILQLDPTNRYISEIAFPMAERPMQQFWSEFQRTADWRQPSDNAAATSPHPFDMTEIPITPNPASNPPPFPNIPFDLSLTLYSHSRLHLILHHIPATDPRLEPHLPPNPSVALRYSLSCHPQFLAEAFYPIFHTLSGGDLPILSFLRTWQSIDKRVQILIAMDANAARALEISKKKAEAMTAQRLLEWIQAPIKEVAASIVTNDDEIPVPPVKTEGVVSRTVKVRNYCQEANAAFLKMGGGELFLRLTGYAFDLGDTLPVYAHISENILGVLVRELGFEGS
ncbi:hypothetical protein HDU97_007956 [Phlyctochytrium planicorne]|nr:hypothetical protein HDU97_007956 [Phlyctochytrium planicorne]